MGVAAPNALRRRPPDPAEVTRRLDARQQSVSTVRSAVHEPKNKAAWCDLTENTRMTGTPLSMELCFSTRDIQAKVGVQS